MNLHDLPQISRSDYTRALNAASMAYAAQVQQGVNLPVAGWAQAAPFGVPLPQSSTVIVEPKAMLTCRLVKVFIADPDENVPLDHRLLFKGDETLTDLTDQELFFDVPITDLLAKHNEFRKTLTDKKASKEKAKDVTLEPIRVRDLKMLVVSLASF